MIVEFVKENVDIFLSSFGEANVVQIAGCSDPWMRGIVLSAMRTPEIRTFVRTEFGGCADWVFADLAGVRRAQRREPSSFLRRLERALIGSRSRREDADPTGVRV